MVNDSTLSGAAVFVDRDGTLNDDRGYLTSPDQLMLLPGVPEGIAKLNHMGVLVVMVTNQSAIGRGLMTFDDLQKIHVKLADLLRPYEASIDGIFSCPHHPEDGCPCRKPNPGLIRQAAEQFSLNLSHCFFVGDKRSDLEAAQKVSVPGVLVMTSPYSQAALEAKDKGQIQIEYVAETFTHAVGWIEEQMRWRRHSTV